MTIFESVIFTVRYGTYMLNDAYFSYIEAG